MPRLPLMLPSHPRVGIHTSPQPRGYPSDMCITNHAPSHQQRYRVCKESLKSPEHPALLQQRHARKGMSVPAGAAEGGRTTAAASRAGAGGGSRGHSGGLAGVRGRPTPQRLHPRVGGHAVSGDVHLATNHTAKTMMGPGRKGQHRSLRTSKTPCHPPKQRIMTASCTQHASTKHTQDR